MKTSSIKPFETKKGFIKSLLLLTAFSFIPLNALVILADKDIDMSKKRQGVIKGRVVFNNKVYPAIASGKYTIGKNNNSVAFVVTHITKDGNTTALKSQPTVIKELKANNRRIAKNSKIILAGENQEEIARLLGISAEEYKKAGSGMSATGGGSGGSGSGSSSNGSSSGSGGSSGGSTGSGSYGSGGGTTGGTASASVIPKFDNTTGGGSGYGSGYIPPATGGRGSGGTDNLLPLIAGSGNGNNGGGNSNADSNPDSLKNVYSTQYCKSPEYAGNNKINLTIIDKDGACVPLEAQRDDTKCEYRYDFIGGVAIKQTQYYYVDKNNQTQNVGGCVDLQGDEYRYPLYNDDNKCQLQVTTDKGYGSNQAYTFQTQILFRGSDGLIHTAVDCTDYQNVEEELISYDFDDSAKEVKRLVNQYYTDPKTGSKIYINNGVQSPFKFKYKEYRCGDWEMDDPNLQAYARTQIKVWDSVANAYIDVTSCDYSNDKSKSGRITLPYIKLLPSQKELEADKNDVNGVYEFEIKEAQVSSRNASVYQDCGFGSGHKGYTQYYMSGYKYTKWKTTYKTTNTGTTVGYQRPKQEWEKEPSIYYISKRTKTIDRVSNITQNEFKLNDDYLKFYEAKISGTYRDSDYLNSKEYADYITKYYKPGSGVCIANNFWGSTVAGSSINCHSARGTNNNYDCSSRNDYILP